MTVLVAGDSYAHGPAPGDSEALGGLVFGDVEYWGISGQSLPYTTMLAIKLLSMRKYTACLFYITHEHRVSFNELGYNYDFRSYVEYVEYMSHNVPFVYDQQDPYYMRDRLTSDLVGSVLDMPKTEYHCMIHDRVGNLVTLHNYCARLDINLYFITPFDNMYLIDLMSKITNPPPVFDMYSHMKKLNGEEVYPHSGNHGNHLSGEEHKAMARLFMNEIL